MTIKLKCQRSQLKLFNCYWILNRKDKNNSNKIFNWFQIEKAEGDNSIMW